MPVWVTWGARPGQADGEDSVPTHYIKEIAFAYHSIKTC